MQKKDLALYNLPDAPGVYLFKKGRQVLYVGKATSLRDRVRSYFDDDLIVTRGARIVDMVTRANRLSFETTPTVLEALVREAALIKKYQPPANVEGKDDKSFLYTAITREKWPRVLLVRGKELDEKRTTAHGAPLAHLFGPFPSGPQLRAALRIIRRIFPFYDTAKPITAPSKHVRAKIEFNRQIGYYPRAQDNTAYRRTIRRIALLLSGRVGDLRRTLLRDMNRAAKEERFEDAAEIRRELFALDHVQDVALIKEEGTPFARAVRIEGYDTAHLVGTYTVAVMVVLENGILQKREYRTFRIRGAGNDDIASLTQVLSRRLGHPEWPLPRAFVVDGGATHKRAAEKVLRTAGIAIPVVAVVKNEKHQPREVIGAARAGIAEADAILVNTEAHRFALTRHRAARRLRSGRRQ